MAQCRWPSSGWEAQRLLTQLCCRKALDIFTHMGAQAQLILYIYILYMYILCVVSFRRCIHVCSFTTKTAVMKTWRPWDGTGELLSSFIRRGPSTASSVAAESHWGYRHGVPRKRNGFLASRIGGMEQQTKTPFRETESACTQGTGHRPKKA